VADINIQEKRGQPTWVWIAAIVALLAVIAVIWALMSSGDDRDGTMMPRDTVPGAQDTLIGSLDRADDIMREYVVLASHAARTGSDSFRTPEIRT
jgi:hypothetical protein